MWSVSAKAYASQGEPDQVKRILSEMRETSLEIKPQVWGSLVYALVNAGQLEGWVQHQLNYSMTINGQIACLIQQLDLKNSNDVTNQGCDPC